MKLTHLLLFLALFSLTACTSNVHVKTKPAHSHATVDLYFTNIDKDQIRHYYLKRPPYKTIPPGHYKRRGVPFQRQQTLPSHIAYQRLPMELEKRLRPLPQGYIRVRIGDEFAILNTRTRVVYDVIWLFD